MFFAVVLSLVALAAAVPVQYDLQQQEIEDIDMLPYYNWHRFYPYLMNTHGTSKNARYFPYFGLEREAWEGGFMPYNTPFRSNYNLRYLNKPVTGAEQPKIDFDSKDVYHVHNVNHHHLVNNIHDIKQREVIGKVGREINTPFFPYSPMSQFMNMDKYYSTGYPYGNRFYGKSLDQEYIHPHNFYNRYWDMDYVRNYYSRNLDNVRPIISNKYDIEYTRPVISENQFLKYAKPVINRGLDVELVKPVVSKNLGLQYAKPILSQNMDIEYIRPVVGKNLNIEYVKPVISKSLGETLLKNWNTGYMPAPLETTDLDFLPDSTTRHLGEGHNYGKWAQRTVVPNVWGVERGFDDILGMDRLKQDQDTLTGIQIAPAQIGKVLNQETPMTRTIDMGHQTPMITDPDVFTVGPSNQEGLRQGVQLNAHHAV